MTNIQKIKEEILEDKEKCGFCGRPTKYFSYELVCYVCPTCLGRYRKSVATAVYYRGDWNTSDEPIRYG